jgi:uracil phosphoribosyltransferase
MQVHDFSKTNSLLTHFLREIRDVNIQNDSLRFRRNFERVGEIIAYEISKTLNYTEEKIQTPLAKTQATVITDKIVLATVFRAGLPFHQGFLNYFDNAENAFVSAYRKYKDALKFEVMIEYIAAPSIEGKTLILVDPMLATGSSMELAYQALLQRGEPAHIHVVSIIASKAGVNYVKNHFPKEKTTIWTGAIDPELNEHAYIVPGLGDAGDLAFGCKL